MFGDLCCCFLLFAKCFPIYFYFFPCASCVDMRSIQSNSVQCSNRFVCAYSQICSLGRMRQIFLQTGWEFFMRIQSECVPLEHGGGWCKKCENVDHLGNLIILKSTRSRKIIEKRENGASQSSTALQGTIVRDTPCWRRLRRKINVSSASMTS